MSTQDNNASHVRAAEILKKPTVKAGMKEWLEEEGITKDALVTVMKEGLEAKKTATFEGQVLVSDEPDHVVRLSVAKLALELMGETKKKPESKPGNRLTVNIKAKQGTENQVRDLLLEQLKGSAVEEVEEEVIIEQE